MTTSANHWYRNYQPSDKVLLERYSLFKKNMNDPTLPSVRVFDPLSQKQLDELELIREISKSLQTKKEEDLKKAAQAAAEEQERQKNEEKIEAEKTEENNDQDKKEE